MAKKKVFQISNALTEGLEETINAAQHYSGEIRIDVVPIRKIEVDPDNPRELAITFEDVYQGLQTSDPHYVQKCQELESLQTMANSIRGEGIINPVLLYKIGDRYRLVAGERRTLASILAGKSDIQAKILDGHPSSLKISLLQWIENVERSDLSLWERLRNLEKILHVYAAKKKITVRDITITELSNLIGCTKPHAINYKAVLMADGAIKQLIRDNKIRNLEKAALIANIPSPIIKQCILDACLAGASLKKLRLMADDAYRKQTTAKLIRRLERRGRQATHINFGTTKNIKVAKVIIELIFKTNANILLDKVDHPADWNDYKSVSDAFQELIRRLEVLYAE